MREKEEGKGRGMILGNKYGGGEEERRDGGIWVKDVSMYF